MTTPYNGYRVDVVNPSTGTVTEITGVQEVFVSVGRQSPSSQWPSSSCTVRARYPTGYNAPITGLGPYWLMRVWGPGRYPDGLPTWIGNVRDHVPEWGIPWNSTTNRGEADQLVINGSGVLTWNGIDTKPAYTNQRLWELVNTYSPAYSPFTQDQQLKGQYSFFTTPSGTYNENDFWQRISQTVDGRLLDGVCATSDVGVINKTTSAFYVSSQCDILLPTTRFSDTTNNATNRKYDQLDFATLADNYYLTAEVDTISVGTYTTTGSGQQIQYSTYNASSELAQQLGKYLVNRFGSFPSVPRPIRLSAIASVQHTDNLDSFGLTRDSAAV